MDVIVHNAGVFGANAPIADSDPDTWWNTWDTNVHGPYLVTRAFLPLLLKGGDKHIVYVNSVGAWLATPGLSAYQPSKLALARFAEFVQVEYGEKGVLAFSVHPGNVPGVRRFATNAFLFQRQVGLGAETIAPSPHARHVSSILIVPFDEILISGTQTDGHLRWC